MKEISLREKLVSILKLEDFNEYEKEEIVSNLTQLAVEKTLREVVDKMSIDELSDLQQYIAKDSKDLLAIYQEQMVNLSAFFILFNKNINELSREFVENNR